MNNYSWLDINVADGYNYYRIVSTDISGKKEYSTIAKVLIDKGKQSISVYPNPVVMVPLTCSLPTSLPANME